MNSAAVIPYGRGLVSLANTREVVAASRVGGFEWERFKILQGQCTLIERRVQGGSTIEAELERVSRRWDGKTLRSGKTLKLSRATMRRIYFEWKRRGDAAFHRDYKGPQSKVPTVVVKTFLTQCLDAGVYSRAEVIRMLQLIAASRGGRVYSVESFYRAVPVVLRRKLAAMHGARMKAYRLAEEIRSAIPQAFKCPPRNPKKGGSLK